MRIRKALLAAVGGLVWLALGAVTARCHESEGSRADESAIRWTHLAAPPPHTTDLDPVWSPDGNHLYFWRGDVLGGEESIGPKIMHLDLSSGQLRPIANGDSPAVSPDGRWLAYINAANGITVEDLATGEATVVAEKGSRPSWASQGRLAYSDPQGQLWLVDVPGFRRQLLIKASVVQWRFSPDARWLAAIVDTGKRWPMRVLDTASGSSVTLTQVDCRRNLSWSHDSRLLAFAGSSDPREAKGDRPVRVYLYDVQAGRLRALTDGPADYDPDWSPDARRLAYAHRSPVGDSSTSGDSETRYDYELRIFDFNSKQTTALTSNSRGIGRIRWSPNGRWLSHSARTWPGWAAVGLIRSDGSISATIGDPRLIPFAWSPDSGRLICNSQPDGEPLSTLWMVEVPNPPVTDDTTDQAVHSPIRSGPGR